MFSLVSFYPALSHSGIPWLKEQNPHIDWGTGKVMNWAEGCTKKCFKSCHALNVKSVFNIVVV